MIRSVGQLAATRVRSTVDRRSSTSVIRSSSTSTGVVRRRIDRHSIARSTSTSDVDIERIELAMTRAMETNANETNAPTTTTNARTTTTDVTRGAFAGVIARIATHPFDTLKARAQVRARTMEEAPRVATGGRFARARTLYAGFGAVVAFAPLGSGIYFASMERGNEVFGQGPIASCATGAVAQASAGMVYAPLDVVKERLQTRGAIAKELSAGTYRGVAHAIGAIAREEGIRGFFRGYWAQNFVWWPWSAMYFVLYDDFRARCGGAFDGRHARDIEPWVSSACATAAAACATIATHPLDLAKTRLQTMKFAPGEASVARVLRNVFAREGVRGLFAGVGARVASVAPGSAISFYVYETLKRWEQRL